MRRYRKQGTSAEALWRSADGVGFVEQPSELLNPSECGSPDLEAVALSEPEAGMGMVTCVD